MLIHLDYIINYITIIGQQVLVYRHIIRKIQLHPFECIKMIYYEIIFVH